MTNTATTTTPAWRLAPGDFFTHGSHFGQIIAAGPITTDRNGQKVAEVSYVQGPDGDEPVLRTRIPVDAMVEAWS